MIFIKQIKKFFTFYKVLNKGLNKEFLGEYDKAIRELLFAISLNYNSVAVYKALIRLNKKNRMFQNALDYAETACFKFPQDAFLFAQQADIYRILKQFDLAISFYDKAIFLDDKCIDYYKYRAQIKYYIGDIQGSINDYSGAILREKNSSDLYAQRAFYHLELKNYENAISDYSKAIELNSKNPHLYFMRSCIYKLINNIQAADKDMDFYSDFKQNLDKKL